MFACLLLARCSDKALSPLDSSGDLDSSLLQVRPYESKEPAGYDPQQRTPLVLLLHGYGVNGAVQKSYFGLGPLADSAGFLLAYLLAVLRDMKRRYNVDSQRVFIVGHSNGGFMGYRLACELSEQIAGVVSMAGAAWKDPSRCHPTTPVAILQIHGDADDTVRYEGGPASLPLTAAYPSAHDTAAQ